MEFNYKYKGVSNVKNNVSGTEMAFAPDVLRDPTYFIGTLQQTEQCH